ncbi:MAG: hypothetical protein AAB649_05935 [Patescibacteria group bacterium]
MFAKTWHALTATMLPRQVAGAILLPIKHSQTPQILALTPPKRQTLEIGIFG